MASLDEYLEKLFAEAFKREFDQEESVFRSLPFIGAAAAIVVGVLRDFKASTPPWSLDPYPLLIYGLLGGIGAALVLMGWFLFAAVRPRAFRYPVDEAAIQKTADQLQAYHLAAGLDREAAQAAAVVDLRRQMIEQFSVSATNNRRQNSARQIARSRAFQSLVLAMGFAMGFVVAIFAQDTVVRSHDTGRPPDAAGSADFGSVASARQAPDGRDGAGAGEAAPAPASDHRQRRLGEAAAGPGTG